MRSSQASASRRCSSIRRLTRITRALRLKDREQALVAGDIAGKGKALREAVEAGAAVLAVCGGYQLLGRFYRDRSGAELPGAGVLPLHTVAGVSRNLTPVPSGSG